MADLAAVVAGLAALPPRVWALVLREARALLATEPGGGEVGARRAELAALLAGPRSAVAAGAGRGRVAALLAADAELRGRLAGMAVLVDAVAALGAGPNPPAPPGRGETGAVVTGGVDLDAGVRELRAELARVRRQRDGADARVRTAEQRVGTTEAALREARERLEVVEVELADAAVERTRAVERAVRRADDRVRELEGDLATERSARERLARDLERERDRTDRLRAELAALRAEAERLGPSAPPGADPVRRPVGLPDGVAPDTTEAARHLLGSVGMVVVDGYNLTLRVRADLDLVGQRRWLLERLRPLAARGLRVVVVFDGDRGTDVRRSDAGVDVRFTSERRIADDEIEFIAGEAADGGTPTLVVTDDVGLRRRVAVHDADVVAVLPFVGAVG